MIHVGIIEDNEFLKEGWEAILNFEPELTVSASFGSSEEAMKAAEFELLDVLLLDIELPGMSGIEVLPLVKEKNPKLLVIMISVHEDEQHIFAALKAGAVGYLQKKAKPQELVSSIKTAVGGGSPMSGIIARKVIESFHQTNDSAYKLNEQELRILSLLAEGNSYLNISKRIYLSVDGVRYHIRNIYEKLQANNKAEAIAKGLKYGIIPNE